MNAQLQRAYEQHQDAAQARLEAKQEREDALVNQEIADLSGLSFAELVIACPTRRLKEKLGELIDEIAYTRLRDRRVI